MNVWMLWGRELEKHALTILVNSPLTLENIERKIQDYKIRWYTFFEKTDDSLKNMETCYTKPDDRLQTNQYT